MTQKLSQSKIKKNRVYRASKEEYKQIKLNHKLSKSTLSLSRWTVAKLLS